MILKYKEIDLESKQTKTAEKSKDYNYIYRKLYRHFKQNYILVP